MARSETAAIPYSPIRWFGAAVVVSALILAAPPTSRADLSSKPDRTWVTTGPVDAIAATPNAIYVGGEFGSVGRRSGPGVRLDTTRGVPANSPHVWSRAGVHSTVWATASDGSGGYYIGGDFDRVGGYRRHNLAHILPDGSVDPTFNPNPHGRIYDWMPDGEVRSIAVYGSVVYVGGTFTAIGGKARIGVGAVDATTGDATGWNPARGIVAGSGEVDALAATASRVYVGGEFDFIGGRQRPGLAAVDAATGKVTGWNHRGVNEHVFALAVSGSTVYAGGDFSVIGGKERAHIAALDAATGEVTGWNPHANGAVLALAVSGSTVYAGGYFDKIGGHSRSGVAALDVTSGNAAEPTPSTDGTRVFGIAVSGSTVYVAGDFRSLSGIPRAGLAAFDSATGAVTGWNPNPAGEGESIAASGSSVYAGGAFFAINVRQRHNLAAFDPTTGKPLRWNPDADDTVKALAVSGSRVYVGGDFDSIHGRPRSHIAAVEAGSGRPTNWNPGADAPVNVLGVLDGDVYASGDFTHIGGQSRQYLAALDRGSGAATSWDPEPDGLVNAIAFAPPVVYVGGPFSSIGGQPRSHLAAVDTSTGDVTPWDPGAENVSALAAAGSVVYVGGTGWHHSALRAIDAATGQTTSWDPSLGNRRTPGRLDAIAVAGNRVFVGGLVSPLNGRVRNGLAGLLTTSRRVVDWAPALSGTADAIAVGPDGSVWAGGNFTSVRHVPQSYIARFSP